MRISTRSTYGVRLMVHLALHYGEGARQLNQIAQAENISEKYLSQIVIPLRNRGLLISSRGSHGGHALAKDPAAITLKDIVEAVDGEVVLAERPQGVPGRMDAVTQDVWHDLGKVITDELGKVTIKSLADRSLAGQGSFAVTYDI